MKRYDTLLLTSLVAITVLGHEESLAQGDSTVADSSGAESVATAKPAKKPKRIYYGGGVSLSVGTFTRVGISPLVGYRLSKHVSLGTQASYAYTRQDVRGNRQSTHSLGSSIFGRYHPTPKLYAHLEPAIYVQEVTMESGAKNRDTVPYLFLGGGFFQPIAPNLQAYIQVTFDLVNDKDSPYRSGEAIVTTGITVGI